MLYFQITDKDMEKMTKLLPLLDMISNHHSDPCVQEMTSDLRIAIATRGTVWSDKLKDRKQTIGNTKVARNFII